MQVAHGGQGKMAQVVHGGQCKMAQVVHGGQGKMFEAGDIVCVFVLFFFVLRMLCVVLAPASAVFGGVSLVYVFEPLSSTCVVCDCGSGGVWKSRLHTWSQDIRS